VIEVDCGQIEIQLTAQPSEQMEQGNRVGAAGDGDQDPVTLFPEPVAGTVNLHPPD